MTDILVAGADASQAGGYFQVGPLTAAAPTDATTPLTNGFTNAGLISLDGVTVSETKSTSPVRDATGAIIRTIITEYGVRVTMTLLAPTFKTFQLMYGEDNVSLAANGDVIRKYRKTELPHQSWANHFVDGGVKVRLYLPKAQIVETGDVVYNVENPTTYEITLECAPDADLVYGYEFKAGSTVPEVLTPGEGE